MPSKKAKRNVTVPAAKPVTVNAAATPAKPIAAKPVPAVKPIGPVAPLHTNPVAAAVANAAVPATVTDTTSPRGLTRDAAGIVRYATNFAQYSDRDTAYLAFFGNTMRQHSGTATLRQIHDSGITRTGMPDRKRFNPNYTGSGKATDVGAINRLAKAGYITRSADGNTLTATALATSSKAYLGTS